MKKDSMNFSKTSRICPTCNLEKQIPQEIYQVGKCYECKEKEKLEKQNKKYFRKCIDCGDEHEVDKFASFFRCDKCKEKLEVVVHKCKKCGEDFQKNVSDKARQCPRCKENKTVCLDCKNLLDRSKFCGFDSICIECKEKRKIKLETKIIYKRQCKFCKKEFEVDRHATIFTCEDCKKEHIEAEKNKVFIRKCIGCGTDTPTKHHRATITYCEKCRNEKRKQRKKMQQEYIDREIHTICFICGNVEKSHRKNDTYKPCKKCCENRNWKENFKQSCLLENGKFQKTCLRCKNPFILEEKQLFRKHLCRKCEAKQLEIDRPFFGKKKHFGYYGIASDGHHWDSLNEQDVEEFLIANNINHKHHPRLKEVFAFADQYLTDFDVYLEIDGLSREDDLDWGGKLSLYEKLGLKYKIIKPVSKHFIEDKEKCFQELDQQLGDILHVL